MTNPPRSPTSRHPAHGRWNWAGNYCYAAGELLRPRDVAEVQEIVRRSTHIKALGSRHSFNDIADSPAIQISTEDLNAEIKIDTESMTATVESGLRYGHFCSFLADRGYALHNLASLPHISVAGACATATHGSGVGNGNLATAVEQFEFVDGTGELVVLDRRRDADVFAGAVVGLGALGVVTRLRLKIEENFSVTQHVFLDLPIGELPLNFDEIMSAGYSVSLFTTFTTLGMIDQVWIKRRADSAAADLDNLFFNARAAVENVHPIRGMSSENCTEQLGVPGWWYERLPHFRMGYTPSSGAELQSEYFVAHENAADALLAIESMAEELRPYVFTAEVRTVAQDDLWLSPSYKRPSAAFHFTWKQEADVASKIIPLVETELAPFSPRPHWAKLFSMDPETVRQRYERSEDFSRLMKRFDPEAKFRNAFLERYFPDGPA